MTTVGTANAASRTIHGLTVISTATVSARQATALTVSMSASSMWSSWYTDSRSTASRSRYSGRS